MPEPIVAFDEDAVRGELKELVRMTAEDTPDALLEEEADDPIRADRYERTASREAYRAGYYERGLTTTSGQVTLRMPKPKSVRFATAIMERYRRRETSAEEVMIEMYLAGACPPGASRACLRSCGVRACRQRRRPTSTTRHSRLSRSGGAGLHSRLPLRLRRRHLPQEKPKELLRERGCDGGHRRQRRRLLRGDRRRRGAHRVSRVLAGVPLVAEGPRAFRREAGHRRQGRHHDGRHRRGVPGRDLPEVYHVLLATCSRRSPSPSASRLLLCSRRYTSRNPSTPAWRRPSPWRNRWSP